ncbi:MAG: AtpZ/AtpI family protein [Planctomycetales bacterium]|nr:AtpZ/AtpI family protein [Planctomycetales bacterium]
MSREGRPPTGQESRDPDDVRRSAGSQPTSPDQTDREPDAQHAADVQGSGLPSSVPSAPVWVRLTGAGMELAFITIVFGATGAAIDRHFNMARPMYSAFGGLLGFTLGMVRFIRMANLISQAQRSVESTRSTEPKHKAQNKTSDAIDEELDSSDSEGIGPRHF